MAQGGPAHASGRESRCFWAEPGRVSTPMLVHYQLRCWAARVWAALAHPNRCEPVAGA